MGTGRAALSFACQNSNVEVAKLLLERGANINHQNSRGMTALHIACYGSCNVEIAKLLLESGANKQLSDKNGNSTKTYAKNAARNKEELLALLARY